MAARNVSDASVFLGRIVKADPARKVGHRLGPCPVGIVLMPGNDRSVPRGFDEKLIMPKPDRPFEQFLGGRDNRPMKEKVVESFRYTPGSQSMKQSR